VVPISEYRGRWSERTREWEGARERAGEHDSELGFPRGRKNAREIASEGARAGDGKSAYLGKNG
jgi:hypothetical protein